MRETQGITGTAAWPPHVPPPTLSERRNMKKAAQPEHSYTGYIPKWQQDPEDTGANAPQMKTRHAPILGYSGHLRHVEDRIGTTFTKGLEVTHQKMTAGRTEPRVESNQERYPKPVEPTKRVTFQDEPTSNGLHTRSALKTTNLEPYGRDNGDFQAKPMSVRSGYGAFDGASGYGEFQTKPMSMRSGYGAFECASGYGEFLAKPMSTRSGYGAFEGASGYGEFQAKPMSARSGYGAFAGASGYGEFQQRPMSARSGYGEFENGSGYGDFGERPEVDDDNASARSGDSRGYGEFGDNDSVGYGDFLARGSDYGAFDNASGYGEFLVAPPTSATPKEPCLKQTTTRSPVVIHRNGDLHRKYQLALCSVGGESNVRKLLDAFGMTIARRHHKRTELLQTIKRNFEKHEQEHQGQMTKAHVKEALLGLSCVFTEDQLMALMAVYDPECQGSVSMDTLLTDLTRRAML